MLFATCASIAAILASSNGGNTIRLKGECLTPIKITKYYAAPLVIDAGNAKVVSLLITGGGNVTIRGGKAEARNGLDGVALNGYAIQLTSARDVVVEGVSFTNAAKALVIGKSSNIQVRNNKFYAVRSDGVYATNSSNVSVTFNDFRDFNPSPTRCTFADNSVVTGLSSRTCVAQLGKWKDGSHSDAVQFANNMVDFYVGFNTVFNIQQGIGQLGTTGDTAVIRGTFAYNNIRVNGYHSMTLDECIDCVIVGNDIGTVPGSPNKTAYRYNAIQVVTCDNTSQFKSIGTEACE